MNCILRTHSSTLGLVLKGLTPNDLEMSLISSTSGLKSQYRVPIRLTKDNFDSVLSCSYTVESYQQTQHFMIKKFH